MRGGWWGLGGWGGGTTHGTHGGTAALAPTRCCHDSQLRQHFHPPTAPPPPPLPGWCFPVGQPGEIKTERNRKEILYR